MKESRIEQITNEDNQKIEKELRNKIQHLETEIKLLSGFGNTDYDPEEMNAKDDALAKFKEELQSLENAKIKADIAFQGRVTIELSQDDGFYLYTELDGNIDRGSYYRVDWGVLKTTDLLDVELQQVMDYFNIDDNTYKIRG